MNPIQDLMTRLKVRRLAWMAVPAVAVFCVACGGAEETPAEEPAAEPVADAAPAPARVFFVTPQDGDTVSPTAHLMFGAESFEIAAVPEGELTETRPALGHHHVAIDTECLPTGTEIPKADPWVHFGTGNNMIDMQLPPGEHTLTLQVGDDLHRAIEGLCETITVTVAEE
jgi:hypothetical protein